MDLGNYERYLNITLTRENNITTGKIYQHVIEREVRTTKRVSEVVESDMLIEIGNTAQRRLLGKDCSGRPPSY